MTQKRFTKSINNCVSQKVWMYYCPETWTKYPPNINISYKVPGKRHGS